jgi:predicted nucleic acid-binding protein
MTAVPRIFVDANVWFVAAASPGGASAMLLALCQDGYCDAAVTRLILQEAEKNLQAKAKFRDAALVRFYRLIAASGLRVIAAPSSEETARYTGLTHPKDTHVLAGASKAKAATLITLDRKHFCTPTIRRATLPFEILTPGAFLHRLVAE